jgi:hypothetical protein
MSFYQIWRTNGRFIAIEEGSSPPLESFHEADYLWSVGAGSKQEAIIHFLEEMAEDISKTLEAMGVDPAAIQPDTTDDVLEGDMRAVYLNISPKDERVYLAHGRYNIDIYCKLGDGLVIEVWDTDNEDAPAKGLLIVDNEIETIQQQHHQQMINSATAFLAKTFSFPEVAMPIHQEQMQIIRTSLWDLITPTLMMKSKDVIQAGQTQTYYSGIIWGLFYALKVLHELTPNGAVHSDIDAVQINLYQQVLNALVAVAAKRHGEALKL